MTALDELSALRLFDLRIRNLSHRDESIAAFVEVFCDRHGFSPTLAEIGEAVGLSAKSTTLHHVRRLCRLGVLKTEPTGDVDSTSNVRTLRPVRDRCPRCGRP